MREHIRREAGQSVDAGSWLVPTVFAIAALAAIAMQDDPVADAMPVQAASPVAPASVIPTAAQSPDEHVQAF